MARLTKLDPRKQIQKIQKSDIEVSLPGKSLITSLVAAPESPFAISFSGADSGTGDVVLGLKDNTFLTRLADLDSYGIMVRLPNGNFVTRSLQTDTLSVTEPNAIGGNPKVDLAEIPLVEGSWRNVQTDKYGRVIAGTRQSAGYIANETAITTDRIKYTLAETPVLGSCQVYLRGQLQTPGEDHDYTILGKEILFTSQNPEDSPVTVSYFSAEQSLGLTSFVGTVFLTSEDRINYTLPHRPDDFSLSVYLNGQRLTEGADADYSITGAKTFELHVGFELEDEDVVCASYFK